MANRWSDPRIDLSPFEEMFGMPKIPVWVENLGPDTLGSYHPPNCACGRPEGISLNLPLLEYEGKDPNNTLLHEAMHALHYFYDPEGAEALKDEELSNTERYGEDWAYRNNEAERFARFGAAYLEDLGMRLWDPER